ncbi:MAG TPA: SDR family NAD(P)-dependent oxidoreductase [Solirubrobacteraceae bacterium]|nr:SDR family NAD(P)-dependent oxidoreductase [Solirubrobacteraceae bacterium]
MPERTGVELPAGAFPAALSGWGGGATTPAMMLRPRDAPSLRAEVSRLNGGGAIARGLGRSYGDAAQLRDGLVIDMTALREFELDPEHGILTAQAGVSLAELLPALVPQGWIMPVLPGTQHVTVGGMLASDVHGKNHATAGSIGHHVRSVGLLTSGGEVLELEAGQPDGRLDATLGGMGLTGVILWARIALRRIDGPLLRVDTDRARSLDEVLSLLREAGGEHRVAWLDLLAGGPDVRGVVTRASHTDATAPGARADEPARASVPPWWPGGLPVAGVRAYNELRFRSSPARRRAELEPIGAHMFPLDRLAGWPRLYGRAGFVQYQFAVPAGQERVLELVPATLRRHRVPCFLAVLKDLGEGDAAPLSFPISGWTLALDLPRAAAGLAGALAEIDELIAGAGGRVYLTKDSRLAPELVEAMYPRLGEWREARAALDPAGRWRSDLDLRLGLSDGARDRRTPPHVMPVVPQRVLLIGGSSEIGLAIVQRLAADGPVRPLLLGRDPAALQAGVAELTRAGCIDGDWRELDAELTGAIEPTLGEAFARLGHVDVVVLAIGVLGAQAGLDADPTEAARVLGVNVVGGGALLIAALRRLREQQRGALVVLSSVAAERPRAGNAVYGAAKAALDSLAQGLSDSVGDSGARVIVVRPGFVSTKMTAGLAPAPLATTPEAVAEATVRALARGGSRTVWVPATLRPLFAVLRHLPRPVYRRLPL